MSSYLDKMNLRPQERRLVVGVIIVIFVVLNIWLVWPHFGDWGRVKGDLEKAQRDLIRYQQKIAQAGGPNGFEAQLKKLEGEGAQNVVADEQEIQLLRTVQSQVQQSKVTVTQYGAVNRSTTGQTTNEFFEEQSIRINISTGEKELVDFLLNIGAGSSMIRVRDMDLRPADQNRYRLQGAITLSANYQKKQAVKPAASAAKPAAPAVKPPAGVKPPPASVKKP
jgi:Tfp pilus assembly protein PilO